jgi:hypothetical protein
MRKPRGLRMPSRYAKSSARMHSSHYCITHAVIGGPKISHTVVHLRHLIHEKGGFAASYGGAAMESMPVMQGSLSLLAGAGGIMIYLSSTLPKRNSLTGEAIEESGNMLEKRRGAVKVGLLCLKPAFPAGRPGFPEPVPSAPTRRRR